MKSRICLVTLAAIAVIATRPAPAQQPAPAAASQGPVVKSTVDEVVLDFIARDKKGKPVTDLKLEDLAVTDNGAKEQPTSFRLVQGAEAISQSGAAHQARSPAPAAPGDPGLRSHGRSPPSARPHARAQPTW
jgi:hypothetical protein